MELEDEGQEVERSRCSKCLFRCRKVTTFLLSHVGLISLVVGYCIMGAFTFEALESKHELEVKRNMTMVRRAVTQFLWEMTQNTQLIVEDVWLQNTTLRLQEFETDLLRAMKKGGWDGSESQNTQQWTFSGALFYSIVTVTTIGYGHLTPKTVWGKVVTIFYAILGIPLMLLCLSHIGDFMAKAFRFLYWKVCCYMCTRQYDRRVRRHHAASFRRGRSLRANPANSSRMMKRSLRRSARNSQRSADSAYSDSAVIRAHDPGIRRVHSDDNMREAMIRPGQSYRGKLSADEAVPADRLRHQYLQRSSRSAEPASGSKRNLYILSNTYAEDEIMDDTAIIHQPKLQLGRLRRMRSPERMVCSEYWDDEADDYGIYGSDEEENIKKRPVPIWLCACLVISYILFGAFLFSGWERWNFLDSAYFCFVTLTTIGFGDFVPAQRVTSDESEVSIALCSLYLLFGISLLAMSFNLVQEQVISNVKFVATRLGIIRDEEEE